ncbi:MAG: hypothetical protein H6811_02385 [Phycisphaeraceae bacterium]|nr:hypothetical protein [Phycisphaeraceae bacterium]
MLQRLITVVLCAFLTATLVPACGGKGKDSGKTASSSKGIVGTWTVDGPRFMRAAFDAQVEAGAIPAGTDFNSPEIQRRLSQFKMEMSLVVKADGTMTANGNIAGEEGSFVGTWSKDGDNRFKMTWTDNKNGEESQGHASLDNGVLMVVPDEAQTDMPAIAFVRG